MLIGFAQYGVPFVPLTTLVIPMVIANLVLAPRALPWVVVLRARRAGDRRSPPPRACSTDDGSGGVVVIFLIGLIILVSSFRRTSLGVAGVRGESMLVDLRDRIHRRRGCPHLPDGWYAEAVLRSAGGSSFAGDFLVASRPRDGRRLQVAVVDVSGKGEQAGSRSLLLSGAFGGLLGALPAERFLPAANDYLLRQDWSEGFATAVHVNLDLDTGGFELRSAGHPPGRAAAGGLGPLGRHEAEGPVLGLIGGRRVHGGHRHPQAGRRAAAVHRRRRGDPAARHLAGHRQAPRPGRDAAARAGSSGAPYASWTGSSPTTTTGRCCCCTVASGSPRPPR